VKRARVVFDGGASDLPDNSFVNDPYSVTYTFPPHIALQR